MEERTNGDGAGEGGGRHGFGGVGEHVVVWIRQWGWAALVEQVE